MLLCPDLFRVSLGQLEAFSKVAELKSFSRAAQALKISQPSLSARIIALETGLDGRLFHRMGRGVRLTELGRAFLPYVERALEALKGVGSLMAGRLNIGAARVVSTYVLPDILERFTGQFPGISLSIKTGRSTDVLEMVLSEQVDVGLGRTLVHPQIESFHLYDEHIVLVTHPQHSFALLGEVSIYDVAYEPLILYDRDSTYFVLIERFCREMGIASRVEMELDSVEATKRMIEQGLGVSFLPRNSIRQELGLGTLVEVGMKDGHQVELPTSAMVRRNESHGSLVSAFLKVLREMFPGEPELAKRMEA